MLKFLFTNIILLLFTGLIYSQESIDLDYAISKALGKSGKMKSIEDEYSIRLLEHENFKKTFLPNVQLTMSLPYQRAIDEVPQFNGSSVFLEREFTNASINLTTKQIIPFTGGEVSLTNSINRYDDLRNGVKSYSSNWVNLIYSQPINGFNPYKWQREKTKWQKKKDSISHIKDIAKLKKEVAETYLDVYVLQMKNELTTNNIDKTSVLLEHFQEKEKYSRVLSIDVKQVQIALNQLKQKLENDSFNLSIKLNDLMYLMGEQKDSLVLERVEKFDFLHLSKEEVIKIFLENNFELDSKIQLIGADEDIDRAKKEEAVNFFIQLGLGLNSNSESFDNLYVEPSQRQFISFGATIPLLNWGRLKNNRTIANLEKDILQRSLNDYKYSIEKQAVDLYHYYESLNNQILHSENEVALQKETNDLFYEMLLLERKTIYEYKKQLFDYEKSIVNYYQLIKNYIILKYTFDEYMP